MTQDFNILRAALTPIGGLQGEQSSLNAPELVADSARATVEQSGLPARLRQARALQVVLSACLPLSAQVTTVNKLYEACMHEANLAHDRIRAGGASVTLASALIARGGSKGMTSIFLGSGEALAMALKVN